MRRCVILTVLWWTLVPATGAEIDISAPGPQGQLRGTFLHSSNQREPVVLLIPGSGPTDRDGNAPASGFRPWTLKLLADGLAQRAIASVRIDKRGMFASAQAWPDANAVSIEDYASDVDVWVQAIRKATDTSCVWLLGHSEGGLVALQTSIRYEGICGLILVATAGRPFGDVLREQIHARLAASTASQADAVISSLEAGDHVPASTLEPPLSALFAPQMQNYLIDLMKFRPTAMVASYSGRTLILQGSCDAQVTVHDAELLHEALPTSHLEIVRGLDHQLRVQPEAASCLASDVYDRLHHEVAVQLVDAIARFIGSTSQ